MLIDADSNRASNHAKARKYLSEVALIYVAQVVSVAFPLVVAPIIIRHTGLTEFGEYALLLLSAQVACLVSEYSFDTIAPRLIAMDPGKGSIATGHLNSSYVYRHILLAKGLLLPISLAISLVTGIALLRRWLTIWEVCAVAGYSLGLAMQASWYLVSTKQAKQLAISNLYGRLLSLAAVVSLMCSELATPESLFVVTAAGILISGLYVFSRQFSTIRGKVGLEASFQHIRSGWIAFGGNACSSIQNAIGQASTAVLIGVSAAGTYTAIDRIARAISTSLKPIFLSLYPRLSLLHKTSPNKATQVLEIALVCWTAFSCFVLSAVLLYGSSLLALIYGTVLENTSSVLTALVAWLCFGILNNLLGIQGLLASGYDKQYLNGMWVGLVVTILGIGVLYIRGCDIADIAHMVALGELAITVYFVRSTLHSGILGGITSRVRGASVN